jgi:hypothetical protein
MQASIARIGLQPRLLTSQEFAAVLADKVIEQIFRGAIF